MKKQKLPKLSRTQQLLTAIALFILTVILSRGADMTEWEKVVFNQIYNSPEFVGPIIFVITQAGSIHMLGLLLIIFLVKRRYDITFKLLTTSLLAYLITGFAKDIWGRLRPHEILPGIVNLDYVVRGPGFPSGHVALATAMALVVSDYLPKKYKWIAVVWIVLVAYSRMYLGIHAPLDIVGGFAIGWMSYALIKHLAIRNLVRRKLAKTKG